MKGELKEYLDYCIGKYFYQLLEKYEFKLTDQKMSTIAASNTFINDTLILKIVNDRGVIETQIASICSNTYWSFDLVNALITQKEEVKSISKSNVLKRLSLSEVAKLMHSKMDTITKLFDKGNLVQTENALFEIGE
ncbi:hypothetical protein [Pontibacter populi]|uniref:Uncharacterized protein n=1 Tax=Pontibacter populi TaxID=890055 RepID=A0ABV1RQM2_9BACT